MQQLVEGTHRIVSLFLDLLEKLIEAEKDKNPELFKFVNALLYFINERVQSILFLTEAGRLWDAEIIMRSVMEATIRVLFVCYTDEDERKQRVKEYWNDLAETNSLKTSEKAKELLNQIKTDSIIRKGIEPLVLSKEREDILRQKWPKKLRQTLNQKWSFSEIIVSLESFMSEKLSTGIIISAMHNYGLSSHLIHADKTGMGLLADRLRRPPYEKEMLIIGHACRLLSDSLSYLFIIGEALSFVLKFDKTEIKRIHKMAEPLFEEFKTKQEEFFETQ